MQNSQYRTASAGGYGVNKLRGAMSMARLWRDQDLKEAKALLDELSA
jgi:hypothetical protein